MDDIRVLTGQEAAAFMAGNKIELTDGDTVGVAFTGAIFGADDLGAVLFRVHYDLDKPKGQRFGYCTRGPDDPVSACVWCDDDNEPRLRGAIPVWDMTLNCPRILDMSWWTVQNKWTVLNRKKPDEYWFTVGRVKTNVIEFTLEAEEKIPAEVLKAIKAKGPTTARDILHILRRSNDDQPQQFDKHASDVPPPIGDDDEPF